jgi:dTDP-4-amino-4,6-dideoxygalactose transaminase
MSAIPLVGLERRYHENRAEYDAALHRWMESQYFTLGNELTAFEAEFASYLGTRQVIGVANGTDAIELVLRALGVGPGDEVVTVAHTFIATVSAIRFAGATPVLVDVDPITHTMDPRALEAAIGPRTRAIIPVHLYGRPALMEEILALAERRGIPVVEDAAQAHGARLHGKKVGTFGRASCFSFYPTKNLGAMGDAGAIATDDDELARKLRALRHHGQEKRNEHRVLGRNSRLDEVQAALLRVGLRHLDTWNARRQAHASYYRELLADVVGTPNEIRGHEHVYHLFVIETEERDALQRDLEAERVGTGIHYPIPVHLQDCWDLPRPRLPVTEALAKRILSIPLFPELTRAEVETVAGAIRKSTSRHG